MNETIKTIFNRRSVRNYLSEQLKAEELDLIIKAGLSAPSARNQQSWHFTVIQNRKVIDDLNKDAKEVLGKMDDEHLQEIATDENFNIFYNAPTIIVISGEKSATASIVDCSAATQNMNIAAESLNIGTCWIGLVSLLFRSERVQDWIKLLALPEGFDPYYAITLGYKAEENGQPAPRRENTVSFLKKI